MKSNAGWTTFEHLKTLLTSPKSAVLSTHQALITVRSNYLFSQTLSTKKAGQGFWKFHSSVLEDEEHIIELKVNVENDRNKYLYLDDKGLRWDLMKMEVRGFTIAYAKGKLKRSGMRKKVARAAE